MNVFIQVSSSQINKIFVYFYLWHLDLNNSSTPISCSSFFQLVKRPEIFNSKEAIFHCTGISKIFIARGNRQETTYRENLLLIVISVTFSGQTAAKADLCSEKALCRYAFMDFQLILSCGKE